MRRSKHTGWRRRSGSYEEHEWSRSSRYDAKDKNLSTLRSIGAWKLTRRGGDEDVLTYRMPSVTHKRAEELPNGTPDGISYESVSIGYTTRVSYRINTQIAMIIVAVVLPCRLNQVSEYFGPSTWYIGCATDAKS